MKTITFTIDINAPINKVWDALWNDDNYREWTNHFTQALYESDWEVVVRRYFLVPTEMVCLQLLLNWRSRMK